MSSSAWPRCAHVRALNVRASIVRIATTIVAAIASLARTSIVHAPIVHVATTLVAAIASLALGPGEASASTGPERRVAIVVGHDVGDPGEEPLEWAESDATRFRDLLVASADVEPERAHLVLGRGPGDVRRAFAEASGRVAELARLGPTSLVVYVSSHADEEALHLGGEHLRLDELDALVRAVPATLRIVIIDACRGGPAVRTKGGRPVSEVALASSAGVEGLVTIHASSPGEPAQEWRGLRGALFTHHVLAGLRGLADLDDDGRVTLAELYGYAFRRTVAYSTFGPGPQRPSFSMELKGAGEWTFSRPTELGARVVLAEALEGPVWITDLARRELVAEVAKVRGERAKIAVRPGRYRVVQAAGPKSSDVADVNLVWGGERVVEPDDLVRTPAARAALRGGAPIELFPWRVGASYRFSTGLVRGAIAHAAELELARELGARAVLRVRVALGASAFTAGTVDVDQTELDAGLGVFVPWEVGEALELSTGIDARVSWARQTFARSDGLDAEAPRAGLVPGADVTLGAALPIGDRWVITVEGAPGLRVVELWDGRTVVRLVVSARAGARVTF
ncbi:caspase family protein [Myxococcota bacterium]|nr:caspase family protein [Myxococcota bacterium]